MPWFCCCRGCQACNCANAWEPDGINEVLHGTTDETLLSDNAALPDGVNGWSITMWIIEEESGGGTLFGEFGSPPLDSGLANISLRDDGGTIVFEIAEQKDAPDNPFTFPLTYTTTDQILPGGTGCMFIGVRYRRATGSTEAEIQLTINNTHGTIVTGTAGTGYFPESFTYIRDNFLSEQINKNNPAQVTDTYLGCVSNVKTWGAFLSDTEMADEYNVGAGRLGGAFRERWCSPSPWDQDQSGANATQLFYEKDP